MKSLLNFIIKFHNFILFILLECFSLFLLIQYNDYHRTSFINSSANFSGKLYSSLHSVTQYLDLKTANDELMKILTVNRNNTTDSYIHNTVSIIDIYDSVYIQKFQFIQGRVINNSINKQNNYLTLNIGKHSGVQKEMAVVSPAGVVGVIKDVSNNFSSVISLLNRNLRVSAMIKRSGYFGSLYWDGKDYRFAKLTDLPNHIIVNIGDTIITSGYSAMFPKGEIIGTVDKIENKKGSDFMTVTVRLSVDFKKLDHIMVIKNLLREEQLQLESNIDYD